MATKNQFFTNNPLYHNTHKLLKNYRDVIWSVESSVLKTKLIFKNEFDVDIEDFLEMAFCAGANIGESKIEDYMKSIEKSRNILKIINIAIETLRSKHKNGEKYYWILYYSYLSPNEFTYTEDVIDEVKKHSKDVSRRTFYRYRNDAINHLSSVLWGYTSHECMDLVGLFGGVGES